MKRLIAKKDNNNFTYVFHSPIHYMISTNNIYVDDIYVKFDELVEDIYHKINEIFSPLVDNFIEYINLLGCIEFSFTILDGSTLETKAVFDHRLDEEEYKSLRNDIYGQLSEGIGKKILEIPIYTYKDNIIVDRKNGYKEYEPVERTIYCALFDNENWKLELV